MGADVPLTPGRVNYIREHGAKSVAAQDTVARISHVFDEIGRTAAITPGAKLKDWLDDAREAINAEVDRIHNATLVRLLSEKRQ